MSCYAWSVRHRSSFALRPQASTSPCSKLPSPNTTPLRWQVFPSNETIRLPCQLYSANMAKPPAQTYIPTKVVDSDYPVSREALGGFAFVANARNSSLTMIRTMETPPNRKALSNADPTCGQTLQARNPICETIRLHPRRRRCRRRPGRPPPHGEVCAVIRRQGRFCASDEIRGIPRPLRRLPLLLPAVHSCVSPANTIAL